MIEPQLAQPGQIVDVWSQWTDAESKTVVLRTENMEVMRLHLAPGTRIPTHEAQGEITIFCLQGRVRVHALSEGAELNGGQLLFLLGCEPFDLEGIEEASLVITILRPIQLNPLIGDDSRQT